MIEIKNLKFAYGKKQILKDISLTLNSGEIIGIIGKSGSGKSAFLKILSGKTKIIHGEVNLNNTPLKSFSRKKLHQTISYSQNDLPANIDDSLYNYLMLSRIPFKKFFKPFNDYDKQLVEKYMGIFKIDENRIDKINTLCHCKLQKLILAHTFIRETDVLLLDNPTENLDLEAIIILRKAIMRYIFNGDKIVIISSNNINFILQTCDRIIILDDGHIGMEGPPDMVDAKMIKKYFSTDVFISRNIYNGKPEVHLFPEN
ncbi:ATP-binding cassette domain-containing protein [Spirochaetota bacterium]